jgi:hypothetical protein
MIIGALALSVSKFQGLRVHGKINAVDVENQGKRPVNIPAPERSQCPERRAWSGFEYFSEHPVLDSLPISRKSLEPAEACWVFRFGGDRLGVHQLREAPDLTRENFSPAAGALAHAWISDRAPDHIRFGGPYGAGQSRAA